MQHNPLGKGFTLFSVLPARELVAGMVCRQQPRKRAENKPATAPSSAPNCDLHSDEPVLPSVCRVHSEYILFQRQGPPSLISLANNTSFLIAELRFEPSTAPPASARTAAGTRSKSCIHVAPCSATASRLSMRYPRATPSRPTPLSHRRPNRIFTGGETGRCEGSNYCTTK